jgi:Dna[CI] antecedent, DciA
MDGLGAELRAELRRYPTGAASDLATAWPAAVGEEIAANAWPARVQADGTLVVHVRDSIWGFELTQRQGEIAARLPGSPPLKFVPGPLPDLTPAASPASPEPPAATLEQAREAAELTAAIADEELRELVARTAAASLARAAAGGTADRPF